jgi:hypothetical protein
MHEFRPEGFTYRDQRNRLETKLEAMAPPKFPPAHLEAVHKAAGEAQQK